MRIEHISKLLGHSNIKTTQIYAKIVNEALDKAKDVFNVLLIGSFFNKKLDISLNMFKIPMLYITALYSAFLSVNSFFI